jgi:hypothetical protein
MSAKIIFEGSALKKIGRIKKLVAERSGLRSRKERRQKKADLLHKTPDQIIREVNAAHQRTIEAIGVCSFAGDPKNILMWSHYANDHEGVCFQFDTARDPSTFVLAMRVDYSSEYPVINWIADIADQLKARITRKHEGWSYEKERRIVIPNGPRTYLPFEPMALTGLIFGCRSSDATRQTIARLLAERSAARLPPVKIYDATKHTSKYALLVKRADSRRS